MKASLATLARSVKRGYGARVSLPKVFEDIARAVVFRIPEGEAVCARCARPGDGTRPGAFGDYAICPRCTASVTSKTLAFLVPHEIGCLSYRCGVCRADVGLDVAAAHRCLRADIDRVLAS